MADCIVCKQNGKKIVAEHEIPADNLPAKIRYKGVIDITDSPEYYTGVIPVCYVHFVMFNGNLNE